MLQGQVNSIPYKSGGRHYYFHSKEDYEAPFLSDFSNFASCLAADWGLKATGGGKKSYRDQHNIREKVANDVLPII